MSGTFRVSCVVVVMSEFCCCQPRASTLPLNTQPPAGKGGGGGAADAKQRAERRNSQLHALLTSLRPGEARVVLSVITHGNQGFSVSHLSWVKWMHKDAETVMDTCATAPACPRCLCLTCKGMLLLRV